MTSDEIAKMSDDELRLAIAMAHEPMPVYVPDINRVLFEPMWSPQGAWYCTANYGNGDIPGWLPKNYMDIGAAWGLMLEANLDGFDAICSLRSMYCFAQIIETRGMDKIEWHAKAPTAARAICEAWLAWRTK